MGLDDEDLEPTQVIHQSNQNRADQAARGNDAHARAERPRLPQPVNDQHELARMDTDALYQAQEDMGPAAMEQLLKQVGAEKIEDLPAGIERKQKHVPNELSKAIVFAEQRIRMAQLQGKPADEQRARADL